MRFSYAFGTKLTNFIYFRDKLLYWYSIRTFNFNKTNFTKLIYSETHLQNANSIGVICRQLLLVTIPVLIVSLVILIIGSVVNFGSVVHAAISTVCVIVYFCFFVMGYGPIPNILCAEIFPTRVRGLCIAICALVFWIGDIIVTYSLPVMLSTLGLAGVFGVYAVVCVISLVFVYLKVPETKGMPLEVITEFFSVGSRQAEAAKNEWQNLLYNMCNFSRQSYRVSYL